MSTSEAASQRRSLRLSEVCCVPIDNEIIWTQVDHREVKKVVDHVGFKVVYDTLGDGWLFTTDGRFRSNLAHSERRTWKLANYVETGEWEKE